MQELQHDRISLPPMSVDIRLCGNITRDDLKEQLNTSRRGAPCSLSASVSMNCTISTSCLADTNAPKDECPTHPKIALCDGLTSILPQILSTMKGVSHENQQLLITPVFEPPSWAVQAKGETRLEPVCEALGRQSAVDLTSRPCFRVGRSPNSDIQLNHGTSSRRHAMLFHHPNGSCYIVDCGSAHGTYVNGIRIASPANGGNVIPFKVRRGALIRFGGPGAPCFVLKSFAFSLSDILKSASDISDMGELVRRNTRINALGKTAAQAIRENVSSAIAKALSVCRKRSFDSLDSRDTLDEEPCKRFRCMSPPLSPDLPFRMVSPDLPSCCNKKHVSFSTELPQFYHAAPVTAEELAVVEDTN